MLNGEIKTGTLDVPANTSLARVSFQRAFPDRSYKVFLANVYVNSRSIIYSLGAIDATGFDVHPFDTALGGTPNVAIQVYWLAIRK